MRLGHSLASSPSNRAAPPRPRALRDVRCLYASHLRGRLTDWVSIRRSSTLFEAIVAIVALGVGIRLMETLTAPSTAFPKFVTSCARGEDPGELVLQLADEVGQRRTQARGL